MQNELATGVNKKHDYNWDLFVIGAGSGGLSAAKAASNAGAKVAIADYVKPSVQGTTWGIGGACVNVGCIPKKLLHFAALSGSMKRDMVEAGWEIDSNAKHSWAKMIENVNNHVKSLNWGYKKMLKESNIKLFPRLARLVDAHTIELDDGKGSKIQETADKIVIAVGGRPTYLDVPGSRQYCISSDDLFWLKEAPKKTLIIGAGYIAMECAGFLHALGNHTSLMVRSTPLRNFDQDMVKKVVEAMQQEGITFINNATPTKFEKSPDSDTQIRVFWNQDGEEKFEDYDTVMQAIGRYADTKQMNLETVGVQHKEGKIIVKDSQTSVENIYAIGDVCYGSPELTPVAIREAELLVERLYEGGTESLDPTHIATTIFTPLEYACIGNSEEAARQRFGATAVEVYHMSFKPLEWNFLKWDRPDSLCYAKLIVNEHDSDRVVGLHFVGPNAGEVMQGYAVAITAGLTYKAFKKTISIHPTVSEEIVQLSVKKSVQPNVVKKGCCAKE